jgi:NAD(P)-dependent dehydrogenase (short-subunit alcohol dehydrogenase family)
VTAYRLDVLDASHLASMIGVMGAPFDRVIHNAGILGGSAEMMMRVNAEAPITVVQALLDAGLVVDGGQVAIMTSQMGARRGRTGNLGGYGESKAALNDEFRRRAASWAEAGVTAVVMHPGWVRTDMGGAGASIGVEESADGITAVLDALTPAMHARFWTWDGREHPW